jgi:hypothetical protein
MDVLIQCINCPSKKNIKSNWNLGLLYSSKSAKKNEREKAEAPSAKEKKRESNFFLPLPHHTGDPVPWYKSIGQG